MLLNRKDKQQDCRKIFRRPVYGDCSRRKGDSPLLQDIVRYV